MLRHRFLVTLFFFWTATCSFSLAEDAVNNIEEQDTVVAASSDVTQEKDLNASPRKETLLLDLTFPVALTDATFEHETQASTGQTTGSWLVAFHSIADQTLIHGEIPDESFWTDHNVVFATVNTKYSANTWERFAIKKLPSFIFIHKGKFYRLPKPPGGYTWPSIQRFVTQDYALDSTPEDIPPPRGTWSFVWDVLASAQNEGGPFFFGILAVFAVMSLAAIANVMYQKAVQKPKHKKQ